MKNFKKIINLLNLSIKQKRRWVCFKINQNKKFFFYFLNILVLENYIVSYKTFTKNNKLWIEIIFYTSINNSNNKKLYLKKTKEKVKLNSLWTKNSYSSILLLNTNQGILTNKDCLKLNLGGTPLLLLSF